MDVALKLGEDSELGYRLAECGAVFVPDREARSWHLGQTHVMRRQDEVNDYNFPFLADRIPDGRVKRATAGRQYAVPYLEVVLDTHDRPHRDVVATVDAVLASTIPDLVVTLLGPWSSLGDERVAVLDDPCLDARLVHASYASEPRVRLVERLPEGRSPAMFRLTLSSATWAPKPKALNRMVRELEWTHHGLRVGADARRRHRPAGADRRRAAGPARTRARRGPRRRRGQPLRLAGGSTAPRSASHRRRRSPSPGCPADRAPRGTRPVCPRPRAAPTPAAAAGTRARPPPPTRRTPGAGAVRSTGLRHARRQARTRAMADSLETFLAAAPAVDAGRDRGRGRRPRAARTRHPRGAVGPRAWSWSATAWTCGRWPPGCPPAWVCRVLARACRVLAGRLGRARRVAVWLEASPALLPRPAGDPAADGRDAVAPAARRELALGPALQRLPSRSAGC